MTELDLDYPTCVFKYSIIKQEQMKVLTNVGLFSFLFALSEFNPTDVQL